MYTLLICYIDENTLVFQFNETHDRVIRRKRVKREDTKDEQEAFEKKDKQSAFEKKDEQEAVEKYEE